MAAGRVEQADRIPAEQQQAEARRRDAGVVVGDPVGEQRAERRAAEGVEVTVTALVVVHGEQVHVPAGQRERRVDVHVEVPQGGTGGRGAVNVAVGPGAGDPLVIQARPVGGHVGRVRVVLGDDVHRRGRQVEPVDGSELEAALVRRPVRVGPDGVADWEQPGRGGRPDAARQLPAAQQAAIAQRVSGHLAADVDEEVGRGRRGRQHRCGRAQHRNGGVVAPDPVDHLAEGVVNVPVGCLGQHVAEAWPESAQVDPPGDVQASVRGPRSRRARGVRGRRDRRARGGQASSG